MYMVSWSSTLRKSFLKTKVLFNLQNFDFIDLGSGKGKATLYARKSNLLGESDRYFGIDFEKSLVEIAKRNSIKMFGDPGNFFAEDVVEVEWDKYSRKLLIYMYNPFDSIVLKQVLEKIKTKKVIIVYVNPVETPLLVENGYKILYSFKSWHANLTYTLFTNMQILTEGRRQ
jgi:SAM-dependent methyltransferase